MIFVILLPLLFCCSCTTLNSNNNYGFIPNQEDNVIWEQQSRENLLDSQDGSYRKSDGAVIWSSNPQ